MEREMEANTMLIWVQRMCHSLKQTRESLEKWCRFLEQAISETEKRYLESIDAMEDEKKAEDASFPEAIDLNEIEKLLAKARTVRIHPDKASEEVCTGKRNKKIKDPYASERTVCSANSSVKPAKGRIFQPQKEKTETLKRSTTAAARKTALPSASTRPRETKSARSKNPKDIYPKEIISQPLGIDSLSGANKGVPNEEEKTREPCSGLQSDDPALTALCDKIDDLKKKMLQEKLNHGQDAHRTKVSFVTEVEEFFTDISKLRTVDERYIIEAANHDDIQERASLCSDFGLRVKNTLEENKQSVTRQIISSLHGENIFGSVKELDSLISLVLDYEQLKMERNFNEFITKISMSILQSPEVSKSEKVLAYRKFYGLLFEDGERLPTLISDADQSECCGDDDT